MSMEHIRTIELERYFAGELGGADAERIGRHVIGCAECGARLAELEADRRRFLNLHPFEEFARCNGVVKNVGNRYDNINNINILDNIKKVNRINILNNIRKVNKINILNNNINVNKKRFAGWAGAPGRYGVIFAAAVTLMLVPVALTTYRHKPPVDDVNLESSAAGGIRYKGVERLSFMLMRDGEVRLGSPAEAYRAGDGLQIIYSYPKSHHAALFSIDNAGTVSFYASGAGNSVCSVPADSGSDLAFPSSIILDDSRGEELVVMLIFESPVSAEKVSNAVRRLSGGNYGDLSGIEDRLRIGEFGADVSVSSVRIKKE